MYILATKTLNSSVNRFLILVCSLALLSGCGESQTPNMNQNPHTPSSTDDGSMRNNQVPSAQQQPRNTDDGSMWSNQVPPVQQQPTKNQGPMELFTDLNGSFINDYCGLWQLYKRKPKNENERLITENNYLDLKNDFTYNANGYMIRGGGEWFPSFNYSNTGEQLSFLLFLNSKYEEAIMTRAELIMDNGTKMLKITDLKEGGIDYYIRK